MQDFQQLGFIRFVAFPLSLVVDLVQEHHGNVTARASLACFEQEHRSIREDVPCRGIVGGFDVAGCNHAELLLGFVEVAFCDSANALERVVSLCFVH